MKRVGSLFNSIADRKTFAIAMARAAQGKRHRREVREFLAKSDEQIALSIDQLRRGTYRFSPYREFFVRDNKTRLIHAPVFRDRVVHHAMIHAVGPVFERGASHHSYACRRGKGHHAAISQAKKWTRAGRWFLKLDIEKFYDSIDHDRLRALLCRRFRERRLLALFDRLIDSYCFHSGKGIPIGSLTSQYLGNFYLDTVDRWMKQTMKVSCYVRYMDDMVLWGTHRELLEVLRETDHFLDLIGLRATSNRQLNRCEMGLPFLGFVVYPNRLRLNRSGRKRLRGKIHRIERKFTAGEITELDLQQRSQSLFAHAAIADDIDWRREIARFTLDWES